MLKVLIVDDELLARLALRSAIPWEEHGMTVVAEAEDGMTGFQYVEQLRPDIVLTDISMPGMNGVELIKKTREVLPDTEIIILSCHDDFEYVKEGLRAGAADYILKLSMSMEELLKELLLIKEKILKKQTVREAPSSGGNRERWPELLFSLITDEEHGVSVLEEGRACGLFTDGDYIMLSVLAVDCVGNEIPDYGQSTMIGHLVEAIMARYKVGKYIPFEKDRGIILCQLKEMKEAETVVLILKNMIEELLDLIHDYHGVYASAGISNVNHVSEVQLCYRQAYEALSQRFYSGPGQIHHCSEGIAPGLESVQEMAFKELMKAADLRDWEIVEEKMTAWLGAVKQFRNPGISTVKKEIHELLFRFHSGGIDSSFVECAYHQIQKQNYLKDMSMTLKEFLKDAIRSIEHGKHEKKEITQAKKYVAQYYIDNIKLSDVAIYVGMNVDYFSHLFKKETGSSFTDYLNDLRIEKAKLLLSSGEYRVYEAAFAVGFQDENYFIKRFKKQTGYTPSEYMRS